MRHRARIRALRSRATAWATTFAACCCCSTCLRAAAAATLLALAPENSMQGIHKSMLSSRHSQTHTCAQPYLALGPCAGQLAAGLQCKCRYRSPVNTSNMPNKQPRAPPSS
jgi:hypothetical protein